MASDSKVERFEEKVRKFWKWKSTREDIYPFLEVVGREWRVRDNLPLTELYGKQQHWGDTGDSKNEKVKEKFRLLKLRIFCALWVLIEFLTQLISFKPYNRCYQSFPFAKKKLSSQVQMNIRRQNYNFNWSSVIWFT